MLRTGVKDRWKAFRLNLLSHLMVLKEMGLTLYFMGKSTVFWSQLTTAMKRQTLTGWRGQTRGVHPKGLLRHRSWRLHPGPGRSSGNRRHNSPQVCFEARRHPFRPFPRWHF